MADNIVFSRLGQLDLTGDAEAAFRDQFIPELMASYDSNRFMAKFVRNKTITKGNSASFPVLGTAKAYYFSAGDNALEKTQSTARNEVKINVDPYLVWSDLFYDLDVHMTEFDDRQYIAREGGIALATMEEQQLMQVGVLAARANGVVTGREGGTVINAGATVATDGATLAAAIYSAGVALDDKKVPTSDRIAILKPLQFSLLAQYENVVDRNIGNGDYAKGTVGELDGIRIIKSVNLPQTNIEQSSSGTNPNNVYYGDFSNTAALVLHKDAIGTINLVGLHSECKWLPERQAHFMITKISQGHGYLRPEGAVEISKAEAA